jgi:hypothetical protein
MLGLVIAIALTLGPEVLGVAATGTVAIILAMLAWEQ